MRTFRSACPGRPEGLHYAESKTPLDLVDINLPVGERLGPGPDVGDVRIDAVW